MSDRLGKPDESLGSFRSIVAPPLAYFPERRKRRARGLRRFGKISTRRALARLRFVLRIFSRRYGARRRREPPDRLDGTRRQAFTAIGRVKSGNKFSARVDLRIEGL